MTKRRNDNTVCPSGEDREVDLDMADLQELWNRRSARFDSLRAAQKPLLHSMTRVVYRSRARRDRLVHYSLAAAVAVILVPTLVLPLYSTWNQPPSEIVMFANSLVLI